MWVPHPHPISLTLPSSLKSFLFHFQPHRHPPVRLSLAHLLSNVKVIGLEKRLLQWSFIIFIYLFLYNFFFRYRRSYRGAGVFLPLICFCGRRTLTNPLHLYRTLRRLLFRWSRPNKQNYCYKHPHNLPSTHKQLPNLNLSFFLRLLDSLHLIAAHADDVNVVLWFLLYPQTYNSSDNHRQYFLQWCSHSIRPKIHSR